MPLLAPPPARSMSVGAYVQQINAPIKFLSSAPAAVPAIPLSPNGRRLDVFRGYAQNVQNLAQKLPVQAYTVDLADLRITYDTTRRTIAARCGDVTLTDVFRYGSPPAQEHDDADIHLAGTSLVIAEGHASSYYHFVLNSLVRLAVAMAVHPAHVFDHYIVTDAAPPFVAQTLAMLGVPEDRIVSLAATPRVRCERAIVGQYISELVFPHKLAVQLLRGLFPASVCTGQRLYIERRGKRRIVNGDEVWAELRSRGFEKIRCEELTIIEQVRLFASADAVIAPHGAGLANLAFCPGGTRVIELMSPTFVETIYWFLSSSAGHRYAAVIGRGEDAPLPNKVGPGGWRSDNPADIEIDLPDLRRTCDLLELN